MKQDGLFVTVVIPVYNGAHMMDQCLCSVLNQTYSNYEVLVVNNNSTDATQKIVDRYINKSSQVRSVFEKVRTRGAARNKGIQHAKGEIIVMTDSDCIVSLTWIEDITRPIRENNESVVMGYEKDLIENFWTKCIHEANWKFFTKYIKDAYIECLDAKNFAIKKDVAEHNLFDARFHHLEDFEWALRIRNKIKIRFLKNCTVSHCHKTTLLDWLRVNFERGYWATFIYEKFKNEDFIIKEDMFDVLRVSKAKGLWDLLVTPFRALVNRPFSFTRKHLFEQVSNFGWKAGLLMAKGKVI